MERRPDSVLIIGILCLVFGVISVVIMLVILSGSDVMSSSMATDKESRMDVMLVVGSCDAVATLLGGIFMLQGANWARWLFVVEAVLGSAAMTYFFSDNIKPMVTTFVFRVICIVILFLPAANRYFESRSRAGR